jgi:tyrosyl-tRNA synthetase
MKLITDIEKIKEVLTRGVAEVLPNRDNLVKLMQNKKIRLYLGIDPTAKNLHLGHTINLRKLQEFADLGHKAILIIGTGTVIVGDPSQRKEARKKITKEEIKENIKTWKKQASKILDFSKVEIKYNGDWLLKLKYEDIAEIGSNISAAQLFQRDNFQERIVRGDYVSYKETMYPLMQGYDSVVLDVDLEIGGTDQVFNMLVGRELQKKINNKEKFILTSPMIMGTDGKPMSKSSGNCVWIEDDSNEMFGKIMSIPDELIFSYFELLTKVSSTEIEEMKKSGKNPRDLKARLGEEIVKIYHGEKKAEEAKKEFEKIYKNKEIPTNIPEMKLPEIGSRVNILDLLAKTNLVTSKSEARRLVEQGAVEINNEVKSDWRENIETRSGQVIKVGRRKFVKIK